MEYLFVIYLDPPLILPCMFAHLFTLLVVDKCRAPVIVVNILIYFLFVIVDLGFVPTIHTGILSFAVAYIVLLFHVLDSVTVF